MLVPVEGQDTVPSTCQTTESSARVPAPAPAMSAANPPVPLETFHDPGPKVARPLSRQTPPARTASPETVPVTVPRALTRENVPEKVSTPVCVAVLAPRVKAITTVDDDSGEFTPRLVAETPPELAKVQVVDPPLEVSISDKTPDEL
jgi:hypothetical protein